MASDHGFRVRFHLNSEEKPAVDVYIDYDRLNEFKPLEVRRVIEEQTGLMAEPDQGDLDALNQAIYQVEIEAMDQYLRPLDPSRIPVITDLKSSDKVIGDIFDFERINREIKAGTMIGDDH